MLCATRRLPHEGQGTCCIESAGAEPNACISRNRAARRRYWLYSALLGWPRPPVRSLSTGWATSLEYRGAQLGSDHRQLDEAPMTRHRSVPLSFVIAVVGGLASNGLPTAVADAAPLQTCTAQTTQGFPISGNVCGGTTYGFQCSAGVIYKCSGGPRFLQNNCTLSQTCSVGCFSQPKSSTQTADVCFSGAKPLSLSTTSTLGGDNVDFSSRWPPPIPQVPLSSCR